MRKVKIIGFILFLSGSLAFTQECPDKIKWKKYKSEIELTDQIIQCVPVGSDRSTLEKFLKRNGTEFSDYTERIVYASVKVKSGSLFIEKKWLMEFLFDSNDHLTEVRVKAGYTGL